MKVFEVIAAVSILGMAVCLSMGCGGAENVSVSDGVYESETSGNGDALADGDDKGGGDAEAGSTLQDDAEEGGDSTSGTGESEAAGADEEPAAGNGYSAEEAAVYYMSCEPGTVVSEELDEETVCALFYAAEITDDVYARMDGVSYVENDDIALSDLRYLRVLYMGFDGETHVGELVANVQIADELLEIFLILYENGYEIEKMKLIDDYGGDDDASCLDNNTSCFNYRVVAGSTTLSRHAYGMAIDINPVYNPYVTYPDGVETVSPESSTVYADRSLDFPHKIGGEDDLCYELFSEYGYTWGGNWNSLKDYQHFQK